MLASRARGFSFFASGTNKFAPSAANEKPAAEGCGNLLCAAGRRGQLSNLFVRDLIKISKFLTKYSLAGRYQ
jgi:hypothetical protein